MEDVYGNGFLPYPPNDPRGSIRYIELDAETMSDFFDTDSDSAKLDCVWISEAMSHLPSKKLFFENAYTLLKPGGKLVIADWFKAEGLTDAQGQADIKPIEGRSLNPLRYILFKADDGNRWHASPTTMYAARLLPTG